MTDFPGRVTTREGYIHQKERKGNTSPTPEQVARVGAHDVDTAPVKAAGGGPADMGTDAEKQVCRRGLGVGAFPPLHL